MRLTPYALILALLTGCLFDTTPQTPVPPTATATPRPTPTPTPGILPVPQPTPAVTPAPRVTATASPPGGGAELPGIRALGQIIYIAIAGGRRDIMAIEANGRDRRRLVAGTYEPPVWSPDGSRFAAYGATVASGLPDQLAIFDGNGRPLARYALAGIGVGPPIWSPDGRTLLCVARDPADTSGARTVWLADDAGLRPAPLPEGVAFWRWTPDNRLAYLVYPPGGQARVSQSSPLAVWSADPDGGGARREYEGVVAPLGWSSDGQTFFALDGLLPGSSGGVRAASVIAVDRRTGTTRGVASADRLAAGTGGPRAIAWFEGGAVAPSGGELILWVRAAGGEGLVVALVDDAGRLLARDTASNSAATPVAAWSPGGLYVAYIVAGSGSAGELRILAPNGQPALSYPVAPGWIPGSTVASWSPDSRWVTLVGPGGLTIAATIGERRTYDLDPAASVSAPAWRPAALR